MPDLQRSRDKPLPCLHLPSRLAEHLLTQARGTGPLILKSSNVRDADMNLILNPPGTKLCEKEAFS